MILSGVEPWRRRVIGVSTCPHVGPKVNEGIWNAQVNSERWQDIHSNCNSGQIALHIHKDS